MSVFRTLTESAYDVEIGTVGVLPAFGEGGVPVERAAGQCPELQDEAGAPLEGAALRAAAETFAATHGLQVTDTMPAPLPLTARPEPPPIIEPGQEG